MFKRLRSNFLRLKIIVYTARKQNETSRHVQDHFRAQQRAKFSLLQLKVAVARIYRSQRASPTLSQMYLRITIHRRHKLPPSMTRNSFKARMQMSTTTASFPCGFSALAIFKAPSRFCSAHGGALMTTTDLTFPAHCLRFVDFVAQFCFCGRFSILQGTLDSSLTVT